MPGETSMGGGGAAFRNTLWTVILRAQGRAPDRREALDQLIRIYWKPVYFFIRRRGHAVEEAKDLTQQFFTVFLEKDFLAGTAREKGRFRAFIRATLAHFLGKEYRRERALKRGKARIVPLDVEVAEARLAVAPGSDAEAAFDREWGLALIEEAREKLLQTCRDEGRADEFGVLEPYLTRSSRHYDDLAATLGRTPQQVARRLFTLRSRLRELIEAEIRESVADATEWRRELRDLGAIFRNPAASNGLRRNQPPGEPK